LEVVVRASGLTKQYRRVRAVDRLDLEVGRGGVYGFLGPNGAGKSTTIRMIVGLIRPTEGTVEVFGRDVSRDPRALSKVGSLVEAPAFYKYLSGRQNLSVLARSRAKRAEIQSVLEEVGLAGRADDKVREYSQGMRQRLGLALAMMGDPELVILDEPTNGLDPQGMREMRQVIRRLARDRGVTVFLSSHLLHEVEQICDRVGIISRGSLISEGRVQDLIGSSGDASISVDRPEEASAEARGLAYVESASVSGQAMQVRVKDDNLAQLNAFLVGRGFRVSAIVPRTRSLEEIYLSAFDGDDLPDTLDDDGEPVAPGPV
jgi:ABC-2 type transport system ATP-binding protein